jgi:hypothetical protein
MGRSKRSKKCETPVAAAFIDETIGLNGVPIYREEKEE